ncbi:MAG: hypothetical protein GY856_45605, partial [bacterium]|nr:hypothetical protein [bacterium]
MIGSFHQRFIWRVAGFPCEALEAFALPALAERVEELAKAAGDGRTLWPQRWSRLRDHPQLPQLERQFDDALAQLRFDLAHLARSERFQLAVTCSSPAAAVRLASMGSAAGEKRRSKHKRLELLAMRYLQRLVTKCETAAFFGPIATGGFGTVECGVESRFVPSSYRGVAFVGDRWLGSIVKLLRQLPRVMLSLRVHRRSGIGRLGLEHGAILLPGRGLWRPAAAAMAVVAAAGKPMRVEDLIADLGGDSMKTLQVVQALVAVGVLSDELDSVWQVADPIRYLRQIATRAGELPAALGTLLDLLEQSLKRWPEADAAACRGLMSDLTAAAQACGISAGSGGGFYSDRMAIVEDGLCHDANLRLDRGWAEPFLADLEQLLRERMAADACRLVALRRKLASALRRGDERWRPFGEVLAEMAADESLRQGEPEPAETSPAPAAAGDLGPLVASPDVMLAAAN